MSTLLLNYTQMKMTHLSPPPLNMNLIEEVCNSLGTNSLSLFVGCPFRSPITLSIKKKYIE